MHLTTLCNTSLDNPTQRNKDQLIQAAVKFLDTDTICYRVDEPATLVELQRNEWDPIIEWAEERYDVEIGSSTSIMGPSIPARTREVLTSHLASYNMWALQGIEFVVTQLKSMVLTLGLIDRRLTVEQAVLLSRLEEEYQEETEAWVPPPENAGARVWSQVWVTPGLPHYLQIEVHRQIKVVCPGPEERAPLTGLGRSHVRAHTEAKLSLGALTHTVGHLAGRANTGGCCLCISFHLVGLKLIWFRYTVICIF
ncbi:ATP synthase mitochondrial F1 complex assembly factor 2 isoform X4 [Prionailurus viverrinus]|nr:ATP synthase mitochondrial F1 complex assembly factor 2 isoform X4 [Prionailurus viverrinus]